MKKYIRAIAVLAVVGITAFANIQVNAQSTGLAINPRLDFSIRPGESQSASFYLSNLNKELPAKVQLNVTDFKASGETGIPSLITREDAPQTPWSLKPFLDAPKIVELEPGESKYVPVTIKIPQGQGAGSYYSAVKYDPVLGDGSEAVVISGAPTQLLFVTVPGKATELMNLEKFGTYELPDKQQVGKYKSLFVSSQPQRFAYTLKNAGNVAESPVGSIVIKNIFGKTVKTIEDANPGKNLALIDQTRRFDVCITSETKEVKDGEKKEKVTSCKAPGLFPGVYKAQLSIFYGINGSSTQEINTTSTFWYLPWWFIGVIVAILAMLAFVIFKVRQNLIGVTSHRRDRKNKRK